MANPTSYAAAIPRPARIENADDGNDRSAANDDRIKFTARPLWRDNNYDRWERAYFQYLIHIRNIIAESFPPEYSDELYSIKFFYRLGRLIWARSSREISAYLDENSPEIENYYQEYIIKRRRLINKHVATRRSI